MKPTFIATALCLLMSLGSGIGRAQDRSRPDAANENHGQAAQKDGHSQPEPSATGPTVGESLFDGRSGEQKQSLLAVYGGTEETQLAVKRGLQWLSRNQRKDGGWSMRGPYSEGGRNENEAAATSMALLAFLGDGHSNKKGDFTREVEAGVKFLLRKQEPTGWFGFKANQHEKMYAQAFATIAICELYGMTRDPQLRLPAQRTIDFAQGAQSPPGGWRYVPKSDSDTSVTGWFLMALATGRSAGLEVDDSVLTKVSQYLDTVTSHDDSVYGYQKGSPPTPTMTAAGLLCRQHLGWQREHLPMQKGLDAILASSPFSIADRDVYYWYYATDVLHNLGGTRWRNWNEAMREELPRSQEKEGAESGSWSPQGDKWGNNSGRLYTTCFSLLCLQSYYRHMPLYAADQN